MGTGGAINAMRPIAKGTVSLLLSEVFKTHSRYQAREVHGHVALTGGGGVVKWPPLHYPLQLWSSPTKVWKHRELARFLSHLYPAVPVSPPTLARVLPFCVSVSLSVEMGCLYWEPETACLAQDPAYGKVVIKASTKDNLVTGALPGDWARHPYCVSLEPDAAHFGDSG